MKQSVFKLRISDEITDLIHGMHPELKRKIKASLQIILTEPHSGKALKDELLGLRSFRVSRFRVVYRINKKQIEIIAVGPRKCIYEETFQIINKK